MTETMYEKKTDYIEQSKELSVWQYKDKTNWDASREIWAQRIQILEDALHEMLTKRALSTSEGVQLDLWGSNYGLTRNTGETDSEFRTRIIVELNALKSIGQVSSLNFNLARLVFPRAIALRQIFPLHVLMWIFVDDFSEISEADLQTIDNVMQKIKAAGVRLDIGLQLNTPSFTVTDNPVNGASGEGVATLIDGSDGGAFVKSIV